MTIGSIQERFQPLLEQRRQHHLNRQRPLSFSPQQPSMQINGVNVINFSSNDYLGLAHNANIQDELATALSSHELGYGAGAAHLVTGHHLHHHLLEDELADWLGAERALLFSTGYMANLAVQQVLMQSGDVILADKLNHASLIDGALNSDATLKRYPHRDMQALERRLQACQNQQCLIVTDGVFSMDGDIAPLKAIQALATQYGAWLMVDDAHGFGMLGKQGRGSFSFLDLTPDSNTVLVGTLGKAFGSFGAFVAGSETLIEALIQFARPYIYTTATPPLNALASRLTLKQIIQAESERQQLAEHIQLFRTQAEAMGLTLWPSETAIQPIILGDSETALQWSNALKAQGFWVSAIRPPTVPKGQARLRVTLSAAHTRDQVQSLLDALKGIQQTL